MLSDEIRARLGQLHALSLFRPTADIPPRAIASARSRPLVPANDPACDLFSLGEELANSSGKHLRIRRPLAALGPASDQAMWRWASCTIPTAVDHLHDELAAVVEHFPRGTMFLDLETCGFAGSMVFLAGVVWNVEDELIIDQFLARDYAEEKALLETLWQVASRNRVLITFNGKSFDWPMVHDRSTRHHLGQDRRGSTSTAAGGPRESWGKNDRRPELTHCDLLHHARRRWKTMLPDCKLQTLERSICRRLRRDDLPGAQVPAAYHQFVRTGRTHQLGAILRHNALDLLTLVQVTLELLAAP